MSLKAAGSKIVISVCNTLTGGGSVDPDLYEGNPDHERAGMSRFYKILDIRHG